MHISFLHRSNNLSSVFFLNYLLGNIMADRVMSIDDLQKILKESCDDLSAEDARAAAEALRQKGLTSRSRLMKVQEKHLVDAGLSEFQALDVLDKLKQNHSKRTPFQLLSIILLFNPPLLNCLFFPGTNAEDQNTASATNNIEGTKLIDFRLNWKSIYSRAPGLEQKLKKGLRLTPRERCKIVEEVSIQIENAVPNCPRSLYRDVYLEQMLVKHKASFEETLGAHGSKKKTVSGILLQLNTRFDNVHRPDRNKPLNTKQLENPNFKGAVGTIRWREVDYPEGKDEQSLSEKKEELQRIHANVRENRFDWELITSSMTVTYKLQRDLINKNMEGAIQEQKTAKKKKMRRNKRTKDDVEDNQETEENQDNELNDVSLNENNKVKIQDIRDEFPFLFTSKGMMVHFSLLTGIQVLPTLEEFIAKEVDPFLQYFDSTSDNHFLSLGRKMRRAIQNAEDEGPEYEAYAKLVTLLKMMLHQFKEDQSQLWCQIDVSL